MTLAPKTFRPITELETFNLVYIKFNDSDIDQSEFSSLKRLSR